MSTIRQHATDSDDATDYFATGQGIPCRTVAVRADALDADPFDEDLAAREDPHLWTRLLRDCDGVHVEEPLATKRRRGDSITADPAAVRNAELASIADLCEQFPEFRADRQQREAAAWFRYARARLKRGETVLARDACETATTLGGNDYRVAACWLASWLPDSVAPRAWRLLERAQEVLK